MSVMICEPGVEKVTETPAQIKDALDFPPFPEPQAQDFEEDIGEEERNYYKDKYKDLNNIKNAKLHCTACDRHLGCSARSENRMRSHPMLRTLVCHNCHAFYNSGEFEKGDDGSELYCRWCGQGGQVYCCSACPHVFCAKCIKRNMGVSKIKEIENTDDWQCFKCSPKPLWDLRAICWALLRYCDLKNKIVYETQDPELKERYQKDCAVDHSECCKDKKRRNSFQPKKKDDVKKENERKLNAAVVSKLPPTIQVKKFASLKPDETKKSQGVKRPNSPKAKPLQKNPIPIAQFNPISQFNQRAQKEPPPKKQRISMQSITLQNEKYIFGQQLMRAKVANINQPNFNGFNPIMNDNINLSLESLTQGLDMNAMSMMSNSQSQNDDVVCTPDFPLEPLCEVTEDNNDDDVECITPAPVAAPKQTSLRPIAPKPKNSLPEITPENIVQMTENDVTVNSVTGGLKFRVDPQTLSSNKMYRLPDGRIFAINANPNMPGGYSATIVAVTENTNSTPKATVRPVPTYSGKISSTTPSKTVANQTPVSKADKVNNSNGNTSHKQKPTRSVPKPSKSPLISTRKLDLHVPVEWYRYNLIDAVDSLEYSMMRLRKLKKDATTIFLRSRNVDEMRELHKTLDRLLANSASRFNEIRENLGNGLKQYLSKKRKESDDDDDDDVEILNEVDEPIFIDEENSLDSNSVSKNDNEEVEVVSSDLNDSVEKEIRAPKVTQQVTNETSNESEDVTNHSEDLTNENSMDAGRSKQASVNESEMSVDDKIEEIDDGDQDKDDEKEKTDGPARNEISEETENPDNHDAEENTEDNETNNEVNERKNEENETNNAEKEPNNVDNETRNGDEEMSLDRKDNEIENDVTHESDYDADKEDTKPDIKPDIDDIEVKKEEPRRDSLLDSEVDDSTNNTSSNS